MLPILLQKQGNDNFTMKSMFDTGFIPRDDFARVVQFCPDPGSRVSMLKSIQASGIVKINKSKVHRVSLGPTDTGGYVLPKQGSTDPNILQQISQTYPGLAKIVHIDLVAKTISTSIGSFSFPTIQHVQRPETTLKFILELFRQVATTMKYLHSFKFLIGWPLHESARSELNGHVTVTSFGIVPYELSDATWGELVAFDIKNLGHFLATALLGTSDIYKIESIFNTHDTFCNTMTKFTMTPDAFQQLKIFVFSLMDFNSPNMADIFLDEIISRRLDELVCRLSIEDDPARKFWNAYYGNAAQQVPWNQFLRDFLHYRQFQLVQSLASGQSFVSTNFAMLFEMTLARGVLTGAVDDDASPVKISDFGLLCDLFRPFQSVGIAFCRDVSELLKQPWFFGAMSAAAASQVLANLPNHFLIRYSQKQRDMFILSRNSASLGTILHHRIRRQITDTTSTYIVDAPGTPPAFPTLRELIQSYSADLELQHPAPGSPFYAIYVKAIQWAAQQVPPIGPTFA